MTIDTQLASSVRRPGSFHRFVFANFGRGLVPLDLRMACVGMMTTAGSATAEVVYEVGDDADADAKFGPGSELALMLRKAFAQARLQGASPQIYAVGLTPPGAGTAQVNTLTFTGPATEDGNFVLRVAGRTITVGVTNGDANTDVAAALEDLLDALTTTLPITAGVAGAVVTCTNVHKGENGGDVDYEVVETPSGIACVIASSATGSGVTDITNALDALLGLNIDVVAIANRKSADVTDSKANTATAWGAGEKKYRWVVIGDPTTLSAANTLSTAANDKTVIIASYEGSPSLPGEIAAAVACYAWAKERPNANYDGGVLDLYPPAVASVYTTTEIESALAVGTTPLKPTPGRDQTEIVRLVTTKTVTSSSPDFVLFDLATSRTAAYMARQIEAAYVSQFVQEVMVVDDDSPDNVLDRIRDSVVGVHRAMESLGFIRDVDDFLGEIVVEEAEDPSGRVNVNNPFRVVSPLHQAAFVHTAYL
ncbi:MAG: hypothetical protein M3R63_18595 [Actinomycetota bacterium]|nr:hypothetical protein [Actinomycetota bacterium]